MAVAVSAVEAGVALEGAASPPGEAIAGATVAGAGDSRHIEKLEAQVYSRALIFWGLVNSFNGVRYRATEVVHMDIVFLFARRPGNG